MLQKQGPLEMLLPGQCHIEGTDQTRKLYPYADMDSTEGVPITPLRPPEQLWRISRANRRARLTHHSTQRPVCSHPGTHLSCDHCVPAGGQSFTSEATPRLASRTKKSLANTHKFGVQPCPVPPPAKQSYFFTLGYFISARAFVASVCFSLRCWGHMLSTQSTRST